MTAMRITFLPVLVAVALCLGGVGPLQAQATDPQLAVNRLINELSALDQDTSLGTLAVLERVKARQALARLQVAKSRDRAHAQLLAERWIEAARDAAQAELLRQQSVQLDRERDQIMVEASRRQAQLARREADHLRLQSMAREEEAARLAESNELELQASAATTVAATAEAAQARKLADARAKEAALARKEAELAAAVADAEGPAASKPVPAPRPPAPRPANAGRPFFTLAGTSFVTGKGSLTSAGVTSVQRIASKIPAGNGVRIEGHTDSQGTDEANLALSRQRAEAVRQGLIAQGIAGARIRVVGRGESVPVADNGSEAGRARNRRVEMYLE